MHIPDRALQLRSGACRYERGRNWYAPLLWLSLAIVLLFPLYVPGPAYAAAIVDVCDEAHLDAALSAGGSIVFACDGTITVSSMKMISTDTELDAAGHAVTISGNNRWRIFYVNPGVSLTLHNLTLTRAYTALTEGGAILSDRGHLRLHEVRFDGNVVNNGQGGIVHAKGGSLEMTNSTFINNRTEHTSAAGIYATGVVTLTNTLFSQNISTGDAGAIYLKGATATISDSSFIKNRAGYQGTAIYSEQSRVTIANTVFSENSSDNSGATIVNGGHLSIADSTFSGNYAAKSGVVIGTLLYSWDMRPQTTILRSTFVGNSGGVAVAYADTTIANSTFLNNTGGYEYGAVLNASTSSKTVILNSTMVGNSGPYGTLRQDSYRSDVTLVVKNSIIANHPGLVGCTGQFDEGSHNLEWPGATCGPTATRADPRLATLFDNGGPTRTVGLLPDSPALDAGSASVCAAGPVLGVDQRGGARPIGPGCDIGAFEGSVLYAVQYPTVIPAFLLPAMTAGTTATLRLAVNNPNATDGLTQLGFTVVLDSQLKLVGSDPTASTCGGNIPVTIGGTTFTTSGITLGAGASCTLDVVVTGQVAGDWKARVSAIRTSEMDLVARSDVATLQVSPAAAATLGVTGFPSPTGRGTPGRLTVKALDRFGNVATSYRGTVYFASSDHLATLPPSYTFTVSDVGTRPFTVTLNTLGTHSLTATDTLSPTISGAQVRILLPIFNQLNASFPEMESARWGDYDRDGDLDLGFIRRFPNDVEVYRNEGGAFTALTLPRFAYNPTPLQVVGWLDYDNDSDLDLAVAIHGSSRLGIYKNHGRDVFSTVEVTAARSGFEFVSVDDYDNDGSQDFFLIEPLFDGNNTYGGVFYLNKRGSFTRHGSGIVGGDDVTGAWGDYDGDGDLDLHLTNARLYRNDGSLTFSLVNAGLPALSNMQSAWADYDQDGDLDLLASGGDAAYNRVVGLYRNTAGSFVDSGVMLPQDLVVRPAATWGDYDNDGALDILGARSAPDSIVIYHNDLSSFVPVSAGPASHLTPLDPGDYDADGDLDLVYKYQVPWTASTFARVYRNNVVASNTPPAAPDGLTSAISGTTVLLSWNPGADAQTAAPGLTYNLRIGTMPSGTDVMSPLAMATGQRQLAALGNVQHGLTATLTLEAGRTYYWSVQAIDTAFAGSPFAPSQSFTVGDVQPPVFLSSVFLPLLEAP